MILFIKTRAERVRNNWTCVGGVERRGQGRAQNTPHSVLKLMEAEGRKEERGKTEYLGMMPAQLRLFIFYCKAQLKSFSLWTFQRL